MLRLTRETMTVWLLGLTQVIGYGTLYYAFAIIASDAARDFGKTQSWFFGIFSLSLVLGGLVMPFAGRAFDRFGAARLMIFGSMSSAISLATVAFAPNTLVFTVGMVAAQVLSSMVLYDAAFTSLVQLEPRGGQKRIMYLTLLAGFASSIFWPLTSILNDTFGWRGTIAFFAALNMLVCVPVHVLLARWSRARFAAAGRTHGGGGTMEERPGTVPPELARRLFLLIVTGFGLSSITLSAVIAQMVPLLQSLGFGAAALGVSTLFGPAQVVVRFVNVLFGSGRHPLVVTIFAMALLPLAFLIVALTAPALSGAIAFSILVGMASGLKSILQGTLPLALFGSRGYGARQGFMSAFRYVLAAIAPFVFAWVTEQSSPIFASYVFAFIGILGVLCFVETTRQMRSVKLN